MLALEGNSAAGAVCLDGRGHSSPPFPTGSAGVDSQVSQHSQLPWHTGAHIAQAD